ncbi:hypothetical protein D8674_028594 [Pyrus ussuriensis x Pyrus communis]|uniref:Uncharacterized protein n=1 Tax=Pyrus ussuriensis x Pyrus communis TaxID=2448454 RepID=A0A5N5HZQ6_9ROSA|nr:hypothetical protein D8674_028594 [Pyrus ussuriensis x Pyrus communis]
MPSFMALAPKAELMKISIESSIPYIVLGILYAYLPYLYWTPRTLQLIFASKYWLPELPGIGRMFSNEMTLASAWIHLLVVDLFAARQLFSSHFAVSASVSFSVLTLAHSFFQAGFSRWTGQRN